MSFIAGCIASVRVHKRSRLCVLPYRLSCRERRHIVGIAATARTLLRHRVILPRPVGTPLLHGAGLCTDKGSVDNIDGFLNPVKGEANEEQIGELFRIPDVVPGIAAGRFGAILRRWRASPIPARGRRLTPLPPQ